MPNVFKKEIKIYTAEDGTKPFVDWLESLDKTIRYRVKERLDRVRLGNFGDHKFIADGVYELRLVFGSGYRIYYGNQGDLLVLLLCGGDKSSQKKDIKKAIEYLKDYLVEQL